VLLEEIAKPVDGTRFGDASFTMESTRKMVGDNNCTGFTIIAFKVLSTIFIFRASTGEPEVNREALICNGSSSGSIWSSGFFALFRSDTGRTDIKDLASMIGLRSEIRNTFYPFVGIIKVVVRYMSKALVPEKTSSFSGDGRYRSVTLNILAEGKRMEFRREMR